MSVSVSTVFVSLFVWICMYSFNGITFMYKSKIILKYKLFCACFYLCILSHHIYIFYQDPHCLHYCSKGVPHGSMEPSCPQGVGLENERGPDSLALGWQLNPKQQGTDVPLIPSPSLSSRSLPLSPCVHLIIDPPPWLCPSLSLSASSLLTQLWILSLSWC